MLREILKYLSSRFLFNNTRLVNTTWNEWSGSVLHHRPSNFLTFEYNDLTGQYNKVGLRYRTSRTLEDFSECFKNSRFSPYNCFHFRPFERFTGTRIKNVIKSFGDSIAGGFMGLGVWGKLYFQNKSGCEASDRPGRASAPGFRGIPRFSK